MCPAAILSVVPGLGMHAGHGTALLPEIDNWCPGLDNLRFLPLFEKLIRDAMAPVGLMGLLATGADQG
jgi:hypothetical protein